MITVAFWCAVLGWHRLDVGGYNRRPVQTHRLGLVTPIVLSLKESQG